MTSTFCPAPVEGVGRRCRRCRRENLVSDLGQRAAFDHSVRTPAQARRLAGQDLRVLLGLLDARTVIGDDRLTAQTRSSVLGTGAPWPSSAWKNCATALSSAPRSTGNSPIFWSRTKESYGGLRDLTVMRVGRQLIISPPQSSLSVARLTPLDTRDAPAPCTGRTTDRLTQQEQPQVAAMLGYADEDELLRAVWRGGTNHLFVSSGGLGSGPATGQTQGAPALRRIVALRTAHRWPKASWCRTRGGPGRRCEAGPGPGPVLRTAAAAAQAGLRISPHAVDRLAQESAPCRYLGRGRHGRIW